MRLLPFLCSAALLAAAPLGAHEFWISPLDYTVEAGGKIKAEIRVGQGFKGPAYPFVPQNFRRFEVITGDETAEVTGVVGDRPALSVPAPAEGLAVIVHQTRDYLLTYRDWDTFEEFAADKDIAWVLDRHLDRGFSRDRVHERYSRYAKSLVAVGQGAGADREVGLLTEIVALANPYTDDLSGGLPVKVLYNGAPRGDAQVDYFARTEDSVAPKRSVRTGPDGVALIPVEAGAEYLVDAVVMREIAPGDADGPVWESLWASLSFMVPR